MSETPAPIVGAAPVDAAADPSDESLQASALAVKDAVVVLGSQLNNAVALAERKLRKVAVEHPYLLMGGGIGSGFVVGGGLSAPLTRALVRGGLRTAGLLLLDVARKALMPPVEGAGPPSTSAEPMSAHPPPAEPAL